MTLNFWSTKCWGYRHLTPSQVYFCFNPQNSLSITLYSRSYDEVKFLRARDYPGSVGSTCNPGNLKNTVKMKEQKNRQTAKLERKRQRQQWCSYKPRNARSLLESGRGKLPEGRRLQYDLTLDLGSPELRLNKFIVLSHKGHGNLLQQLLEPTT